MSNLSDSEVLAALEEFERIINHGISKVNNLLQDAWSNEDLKNIKEEISQSRKELEIAHITLQDSEKKSAQVLQELQSTSSTASKEQTLLNQMCSDSKELYSNLKVEEERGREFLNNLVSLIQEYQQYKTQFDVAFQRVQSAENVLSELDIKYNFLLEIKTNVSEIINRIDGYRSISDLVNSIREATERLQEEQMQARSMIAEFELIKYKVDALAQAQRAPWWWPKNWWWKKKNGFTGQRIRQFRQ
jgi:chromosome segregation ATPase